VSGDVARGAFAAALLGGVVAGPLPRTLQAVLQNRIRLLHVRSRDGGGGDDDDDDDDDGSCDDEEHEDEEDDDDDGDDDK
jgi:hypothetical protein